MSDLNNSKKAYQTLQGAWFAPHPGSLQLLRTAAIPLFCVRMCASAAKASGKINSPSLMSL